MGAPALATASPASAKNKAGDAMALTNLEETIVDRIQRALAKELKRLRGRSRSTGNGKASSHFLARLAEAMAKDSATKELDGGNA
jgi:hypothetical protein